MWPTPQDYNEAVQNPGLNFSDEQLKGSAPEINAFGLPKPRSGSFASVYHLTSGQKEWAVRCFLHNFADQQQRYTEIGRCLVDLRLPHAVDFQYLTQGIRVKDNWFPILKMQWVGGETLNKWVEAHLHDTDSLHQLRNRFMQMCRQLADCGIAHGDLQHGNILVINGQLKLVDYDGMYVPRLKSLGSNELGHRHYQHPERNHQHFAEYLDRFSAWSIYTSLYCLSRDSRLWHRLDAGDECLLFKDQDYKHPQESAAFRLLEHHEYPDVRRAARSMRRLLELPIESLPILGDPINGAEALAELSAPVPMPNWLISDAGGAPPPVPGQDSKVEHKLASHSAGELLTNLAVAAAPSLGSALLNAGQSAGLTALTTRVTTGGPENAATSKAAVPPAAQDAANQQPTSTPVTASATASSGAPPAGRTAIGWWDRRRLLRLFEAALLIVVGSVALRLWLPPFMTWLNARAPQTLSTQSILPKANATYKDACALQAHHEPTAAIAKFQEAMTQFESLPSEQGMALCAYQIAICYRSLHNDKDALSWLDRAINQLHAEDYAPYILTDAGYLYLSNNELNKAAYYLTRSLEGNSRNDPEIGLRVAYTLRRIGLGLLKQEHEQGLDAYGQAIAYERFQQRFNPAVYFAELSSAGADLEKRKSWHLAYLVWQHALDETNHYAGGYYSDRIAALRSLCRIAAQQDKPALALSWSAEADRLAAAPKTRSTAGANGHRQPLPAERRMPPDAVPNPRRPPWFNGDP